LGVRDLPEDLAVLDVPLRDPELLAPIASGWHEEAVSQGRPTIPIEKVRDIVGLY
jgi:hypothetical protein